MKFLFLFLALFSHCIAAPEEILKQMTLDEKIGQLFVAPACPKRLEDHFADWLILLQNYHIGNAIVKQSDPITQVKFLNRLQSQSKIPLLIAADAEWGLAMRMSETLAFPRNQTLGATSDPDLIYRLGKEIGRQAKRVGIHLNLAPVADVNSNRFNPIIGNRSFGENPEKVALYVSTFIRGMQAAGVLACAKHFPGHGDTTTDSHFDLPFLPHSLERLKTIEWLPFQKAIDEGVASIMMAHLYVPSVDPTYPTSLSSPCLKMLREQLHFSGLIISDALNMKALTDRYTSEEIALLARKAGCDLLLYGDHVAPNVDEIIKETIPRAFQALKKAYLAQELPLDKLDQSVLRILRAKEKIEKEIPLDHLLESLHTEQALSLKKELFQKAITCMGEPLFPTLSQTAYLSFGKGDILASAFPSIPPDQADCVVIAIHDKEALTPQVLSLIDSLQDKAIACFFISPYALQGIKLPKSTLLAFENDPEAQLALLQVLKGAIIPKYSPQTHLP
jgi:beta-N-acetylhexosaminidase